MLAADKLLLQSNVKQRSIALREKELKLFNTNFSAVGTQAAIMAGFTLTSFVEIDLPPNKPTAKTMLHTFVTLSICSNFVCVAMVTFVSVWGTGKALRGRDGAMDTAVDGMNAERTLIFSCFAMGVLATLGCARTLSPAPRRPVRRVPQDVHVAGLARHVAMGMGGRHGVAHARHHQGPAPCPVHSPSK